MVKTHKGQILLPVLAGLCIFLSGCGCGQKKEQDPAGQQVLKITITPAVTPTLAPSEVNPDAVVTNGNLTMVNSYLEAESAAGQSQEADAGSSNTDGTGADAGGDSSGTDGTGANADGSGTNIDGSGTDAGGDGSGTDSESAGTDGGDSGEDNYE
ncbi:MAG: hypothetical protein Q4C91_08445 [Eubacteriales bacterium]|nr:hypothetical protein [Eubacteriales bacterium]